jgi:hypothetical protein
MKVIDERCDDIVVRISSVLCPWFAVECRV